MRVWWGLRFCIFEEFLGDVDIEVVGYVVLYVLRLVDRVFVVFYILYIFVVCEYKIDLCS